MTKCFRRVRALVDVSFDVPAGGLAALVGANGAGKSTLLRILATTVLPDAGRATVAGVDVVRDPAAARRRTGVLIGDERAWYFRLTGRQNLAFFASLDGLARRPARERVGGLLDVVGLADAADRPFNEYSSGMRLRLSLARALLREPEVLLLDEPTRALDPVATMGFRELVERLRREQGTTILIATHDLHEATELADTVVLLHAGRTTAVGPVTQPRELERMLVAAQAG